MGYVLFILFVAFLGVAIWRWDGRLPNVYMAGNSGSALPMIDVLKAAGKVK